MLLSPISRTFTYSIGEPPRTLRWRAASSRVPRCTTGSATRGCARRWLFRRRRRGAGGVAFIVPRAAEDLERWRAVMTPRDWKDGSLAAVHTPASQKLRLPPKADHRPALRSSSLTLQSSWASFQDDCKVFCIPLMVSLSNHRWLERASFDKLRMSRHQWAALLCNRPGRASGAYVKYHRDIVLYCVW